MCLKNKYLANSLSRVQVSEDREVSERAEGGLRREITPGKCSKADKTLDVKSKDWTKRMISHQEEDPSWS